MNDDLQKMIEENNKLLKDLEKKVTSSQKNIKKVHSYMRRNFLAKITYWGIIIFVAAGAFYAIGPRVKAGIARYQKIQSQLETAAQTINNPRSLIDEKVEQVSSYDFGILNGIFKK